MMAIAGICALTSTEKETVPAQEKKQLRHNSTGALAATRYLSGAAGFEASDSVRDVDPLLVITNSEAGTSDAESLAAALAVLRERASVEVAATANPGELDGVLHRAGSRRIIVAGGDGSLHAVISALHRRHELKSTVLGLLPLGTGNDFARGTGIPLDIEEAARVVLRDRPRGMDLVVDEVGEVVVNSVHVGAGAEASRKGASWKTRLGSIGVGRLNLGKLGYPIGAALTAIDPPAVRLRVEIDGEVACDLDDPVLMVAIGNGPSVGGGTHLTPEASPVDGKVDVMISRATGPVARLLYAARLGLRTHHRRDDSSYLRGATVSVSGGPFWCSADGEIYGPERHRTWRVEPEAYSLLLP
jgi:diacylglycerol kinase (ATP)